jgi:hypothetical protein
MSRILLERFSKRNFGDFTALLEHELGHDQDQSDPQMIKLLIVDSPNLRKVEKGVTSLNPPFLSMSHLCNNSTVLAVAAHSNLDVFSIYCFFFLSSSSRSHSSLKQWRKKKINGCISQPSIS